MKIVVIDGQGGGLGRGIIETLLREGIVGEILALGTNATATMAMLRAGAGAAATGEYAIRHNTRDADLILGAVGIAFVGSMYGEISPAIAHAVSSSPAEKILIPISKCHVQIAGGADLPLAGQLADMVERIRRMG